MISLQNLFKSSNETANLLPALLSDSSLLLKSILEGLHSTRFAGKEKIFGSLKNIVMGKYCSYRLEKVCVIKKILIKQKEKELSKTIYLYFDKSFSMNFKSADVSKSKLYYSVLLTLTLCKLFSNGKEEVFIFNEENIPINCSNNINNFNNNFLLNSGEHTLPNRNLFKDKSLFIIFSDFLYNSMN